MRKINIVVQNSFLSTTQDILGWHVHFLLLYISKPRIPGAKPEYVQGEIMTYLPAMLSHDKLPSVNDNCIKPKGLHLAKKSIASVYILRYSVVSFN